MINKAQNLNAEVLGDSGWIRKNNLFEEFQDKWRILNITHAKPQSFYIILFRDNEFLRLNMLLKT